jgi:hypothetical protein
MAHLEMRLQAGRRLIRPRIAATVLFAMAGGVWADVACAKSWPCGPTDKEFTCYDLPCKVGDTENGGHCVGDKAFRAHKADKVKAKK